MLSCINEYTICTIFQIQKRPNWSLVQHRVDFKPDEENTRVKRGLLRQLDSVLNCEYIFDGTMLFSTKRLDGQSFTTQDPSVSFFLLFAREYTQYRFINSQYCPLIFFLYFHKYDALSSKTIKHI